MKLLSERLAYLYNVLRPDLDGERGQIGLVRASGASKSMVNQWLSGAVKSMGIEWALQIELNLGISHVWLMADIGDPIAKPGQVIAVEPIKPQPLLTLALPPELELLHLFRSATDEAQVHIIEAAKGADQRPASSIRGRKP